MSLRIKVLEVVRSVDNFERAVNTFNSEHKVVATQTHTYTLGDNVVYVAVIYYEVFPDENN